MVNTNVVILAAGKGKRMGASIPKALVDIAGKPMIAHLLERVEQVGLGHKAILIVSPTGKPEFEKMLGDKVLYAVQPEALGTGDALRFAEPVCQNSDRIIVLYGDHPFISSDVIKSLVELSGAHPDSIAMLTALVPDFEGKFAAFSKWGKIIVDGEGKVAAIREVKDCGPEELFLKVINPGIYSFPVPWVFESLRQLKNNNASQEYYLVDLISLAMKQGKAIVTAPVDALEVVGVNTPEELKQAEALFMKTV